MNEPLSPEALPQPFIERLRLIVPADQFEDVVGSFAGEKQTAFRVNPLQTTTEQLVETLKNDQIRLTPVDWCPGVFLVEPRQRAALTHSPRVTAGEIYVQGLSSILASLILDPQPDQQVLDLAAAPGGKATHMAALMNNQGWLSVVEPVRRRMFLLADNLQRAGVTISHTYLMDGRKAGDKVPNRFDRVMLDAPCSGESRFHINHPDSWKYWGPRKIREQSRKQRGLIRSAFNALKPGGRMLYCTCSFAPEENEAIVDGLLSEFPDEASLVPIDLLVSNWQPGLVFFENKSWDEQLRLARRILPNELHDGFFLTLIAKRHD